MADPFWDQALRAATAQGQAAAAKSLPLRMVPVQAVDIDRIHEIEKTAYAYPWSRKHFEDSLHAGHAVVAVVAQAPDDTMRPAAWVHAPTLHNGTLVLSYGVAMMGVQEVHVLNVTTPPAQRRHGWARLWLNTVAHWGRQHGAQTMWLEVRRSNAGAQALYASMGFEAVGVRKGYYPDAAGQREDAIVMRLALLH